MSTRFHPLHQGTPSEPTREARQRRLLAVLARAQGRAVSWSELRAAGIMFPASIVSELELSGAPIERCYEGIGGERRVVGVRLEPEPVGEGGPEGEAEPPEPPEPASERPPEPPEPASERPPEPPEPASERPPEPPDLPPEPPEPPPESPEPAAPPAPQPELVLEWTDVRLYRATPLLTKRMLVPLALVVTAAIVVAILLTTLL